MDEKKRPEFKKVAKSVIAFKSPEELFYKLNRQASHAYLRGPQQDVLRRYEEVAGAPNVALELPTGTGKTAAGLLISDWHRRRSGARVAYFALTNQLAKQVLAEGLKLGIECADLTGTKETRDAAEVGRYATGSAVAVTTYSNLFNIRPVIQPSELLVFDDAHGGEQYVAGMWTARVTARDNKDLYNAALSILRPTLTDAQIRLITDKSEAPSVQMCDVSAHPQCLSELTNLLDGIDIGKKRLYPWLLVRTRLDACVFLISRLELAIRPIIPPTHTHESFYETRQRVFMSATLGGEADLRRSYGLASDLKTIRAENPQWGRRYIFIPGLYADDDIVKKTMVAAWETVVPQRAVILAPSQALADGVFKTIEQTTTVKPSYMSAGDIEDSLLPFTESNSVILTMGARYDGLDLPDDDCRLLILAGSPAAVSELERHLRDYWKLGPVLRRREQTRLIQGMGRCTRNATDFAVILWIGQQLVNVATMPAVIKGLPSELKAELSWGREQSKLASDGPGTIAEMISGLLEDADYRAGANAAIDALQQGQVEATGEPPVHDKTAIDEVRHAAEIWDNNFGKAYQIARSIADQLSGPPLAGYRAWWLFLASLCARHDKDLESERDCLERAISCGVNAGWLRLVLRERAKAWKTKITDAAIAENAESVWNFLEKCGWAGPKFELVMNDMIQRLKESDHTTFHMGLEALGKTLGAHAIRPTVQGAPDVIWSFGTAEFHIAWEAKTEKKSDGILWKKDTLEAKGHLDWVRKELCPNADKPEITVAVVSPTAQVDTAGKYHIDGLFYVAPEEILMLA